MWTVVYISQRSDEVMKIKLLLDENEIISRVRANDASSAEQSPCFEIMVPDAELSMAQELIIAAAV